LTEDSPYRSLEILLVGFDSDEFDKSRKRVEIYSRDRSLKRFFAYKRSCDEVEVFYLLFSRDIAFSEV
jgi:hypothetical protein